MQDQETGGVPPGLTVRLEIPGLVVTGLSVQAFIYVANGGSAPVTVSSRLNLMEGDVQLLLTGPEGRQQKVTGAGGQPDTGLRRVTLEPGRQIAGAVNLLLTSIGQTFREPGNYTLQAVYYPESYSPPLYSNTVSLTARSPQAEAEKQAASLLQNDDLKRAIVIPEEDNVPVEIKELADRFADTPDGKLASLIIAANSEREAAADAGNERFSSADPVEIAMEIAALSTPFSNVGRNLQDAFAAFLGTAESSDSAQAEKALGILKTEPF